MASQFVGGALLSAYLRPALDHLASAGDIFDYFRENKLDVKLLRNLKSLLLSINVVMDDAENKHYNNKDVSDWLHDVKDVVFDVDDLLDEINTEISKSKLIRAESHTVTAISEVRSSNFTSSLSSFHEELPSRIQYILDNLDDLASQKDILGLVKGTGIGVGMGTDVPQRVPSTSLVDEAAICGRDDDKKAIIDLLLSEDDNGSGGNNLAVISIVGMGKTTLAQLVYNDSNMDNEFQLKAWVCVSEDFDIVRLTITILDAFSLPSNDREDLNSLLKELSMHTNDRKDLNLLQLKLKEKLTGKKFLLVLDDVWEENQLKLETLLSPFVYGARGSKILVTTRSEKVALAMRCAHSHQLKQLPEEQSWLLFAKYALCDGNSISSFEEIGKKIIKKCNGLPLALKAIGSLLYNESSTEVWNRILNSEIWDISGDIIPALRLSYKYLSPLHKRCFAYCSLIPKDNEFEKDWIVELWMAENFLQIPQQKKDMKELGDQIFNDLLLRSFFQKSSRLGTVFVMHDLVTDLATSISKAFCTRLEKAEDTKYVSKMTRHISYIGNYPDKSEQFMFEAIYKANKLRTLIAFTWKSISGGIINNLFAKCKSLRVLSLYSKIDFIYEICDAFCMSCLKHLRYLKLSNLEIKQSASICLLYNLETLYLENCDLEELPPLGILPSLKKLSIKDNEGIKIIGGEFYGNKSSSAAVPFPSLQFLQFDEMVGWEEWDCQNASGAFPCLQELIIRYCHNLKSKLPEHLPSLLKLEIAYCEQLMGSLPPLNSLQQLRLVHCCHTLEALPLDLFPKLKTLRLWDCRNLERLDGSITSLIDLEILDCPKLLSLHESMQTLFPSLTHLSLAGLREMEWPEGGLPSSLEILMIIDCPKLVASQMKWDLHNYTSLTHLYITDEDGNMVDYKGLLPPNLKRVNFKEVGRHSS